MPLYLGRSKTVFSYKTVHTYLVAGCFFCGSLFCWNTILVLNSRHRRLWGVEESSRWRRILFNYRKPPVVVGGRGAFSVCRAKQMNKNYKGTMEKKTTPARRIIIIDKFFSCLFRVSFPPRFGRFPHYELCIYIRTTL